MRVSPVLAQTPKIEAPPSVPVQADIPKTPGEAPAFAPPTAVVPAADGFWLRAVKSVIKGIEWQSGYVGTACFLARMSGMPSNVLPLPDTIGNSFVVGAMRAAYAFSQSGKTTPKQDLSPPPAKNDPSILIRAISTGCRAATVTAGALLTAQFFGKGVGLPFPPLVAFAWNVGYSSELPPPPKKSENSTVKPTEVSEPKKPTKSQLAFQAGFEGYCAALCYGASIAYLLNVDPSKVLAPLLTGSIGIGAGLAIRNFIKTTPDENLPPTPMKSTLLKIAKSIVAGCNASASTVGLCLTVGYGLMIWHDLPGSYPPQFISFLMRIMGVVSALTGSIKCGQTYAKLSGTSFSDIWKRTPKLVKAGIASAALAGLATLYLGPQAMADKLDDAAFAVKNAGLAAQRQFTNLVYTTDTKTETKTDHEWIQSFDDRNELNRLAGLSKSPDFSEFSCAEILNTCDLEETDPGHHSAYKAKFRKFHPDKFRNAPAEDQILATQASAALSETSKAMKKQVLKDAKDRIILDRNGEEKMVSKCPGKDSYMCKSIVEDKKTITFIRETPHWFYAKLTGAETTCNLQVAGGDPMPTDMKDCSF